jgi:hypothetical protein
MMMMAHVGDIVKKPEANMFFSFVIGVGLSVLLFHRARKEFVTPAIDADQLVNSISKIDGKCYRFRVTDASEPPM